jgi:chaperone modulatory protein CbpM
MSEEEMIPLETFCTYYQVERSFIETLESYGLVSISSREEQRFILMEEVVELEKFSRLYYDLNINVPGIDALKHLLEKLKELQQETESLKARLRIYE